MWSRMEEIRMNKIYCGVGSREGFNMNGLPEGVAMKAISIARWLHERGYTLRSGGAKGMDTAFEEGAGELKEIYLPFNGFQGRYTTEQGCYILKGAAKAEAERVAEKHCPHWYNCGAFARSCHTRNVCQIMGYHLEVFSAFVICWTKDGKDSGGTGQAIRIARAYEIPVYNLYNEADMKALNAFLRTIA